MRPRCLQEIYMGSMHMHMYIIIRVILYTCYTHVQPPLSHTKKQQDSSWLCATLVSISVLQHTWCLRSVKHYPFPSSMPLAQFVRSVKHKPFPYFLTWVIVCEISKTQPFSFGVVHKICKNRVLLFLSCFCPFQNFFFLRFAKQPFFLLLQHILENNPLLYFCPTVAQFVRYLNPNPIYYSILST